MATTKGPSAGYTSQADAWRAGYQAGSAKRSKEIAKLVRQLRAARESRDRALAKQHHAAGRTICPVSGVRL